MGQRSSLGGVVQLTSFSSRCAAQDQPCHQGNWCRRCIRRSWWNWCRRCCPCLPAVRRWTSTVLALTATPILVERGIRAERTQSTVLLHLTGNPCCHQGNWCRRCIRRSWWNWCRRCCPCLPAVRRWASTVLAPTATPILVERGIRAERTQSTILLHLTGN